MTSTLLPGLTDILTWTRRKQPEEHVGTTVPEPDYVLARCLNEVVAIERWHCTHAYAENSRSRYYYPADLADLVGRLNVRYPKQRITARQFLALVQEVAQSFNHVDVPLAAPVGTRVTLLHEGKDYHGAGCACGLCNSNGHSYECRILEAPQSVSPGASLEDSDCLHVEYTCSQEASEANCRGIYTHFGWVIE